MNFRYRPFGIIVYSKTVGLPKVFQPGEKEERAELIVVVSCLIALVV